MQKKCDIYLCCAVKNEKLRFINLFDKNFVFDENKYYEGFLSINVDRVKLIPVILDLRREGITCFSAPVDYRDGATIAREVALGLAKKYASSLNSSVKFSFDEFRVPPVIWVFDLVPNSFQGDVAGGLAMVDKLDGHIWTTSEYEEYMYDYNNML
ncbi:hypothetical protein [Comamonas sediminis]|uniref:Uncharacterized protein n=1 Tax=Comamonas sediminis TaxID=1783360 RepID=A0ABV4B5V6_9BURK